MSTRETIAFTRWTFVGKVMSLLFNMLSRFLIAFLPRSSEVKATQSCPTLCDPMAYTVHGILQARILEWVAFPFSRGSSQPRSPTLQADSLPAEPPGIPFPSKCSAKAHPIISTVLRGRREEVLSGPA